MTAPNKIKLIFNQQFSLNEIKSFWEEIEVYFPTLDGVAPECKLNQAKSFREKQKVLTINN